MGAFCCDGNQSFDPICPKTLCSLSPTLVMLHIKFDLGWPTGFRDIQVWKCGRRRRTDDGPLLYYKLTLWAFGSGELKISWILDIHNSIFGYPKMYFMTSINQFLDIQKWIMDIQKSFYGYPKIHFWISKNNFGYPFGFWISLNTLIFGCPKNNYGYPKIKLQISWIQHDFWISKTVFQDILKYTAFWISKHELWISKNRIMDIQSSAWFLDIQKWIFWISKNPFMDILKYIFGYPNNFGYP